ncbi:MAG TPA: RsmE family RNA methyltransferase [Synergistaceae bacterium]|nr:RsmE family RNA methyltransferase [Synergistaceae bacterium]
MSLPRIRLDRCLRTPEGVWMLSEEEAHHLVRVRRCGEGDLAEGLLPGWKITLRLFARENAWFGEECSRSAEGREDLFMVLLVALLKGEAFEKMLRQVTELGVSCIVPLACERSIPRIHAAKLSSKMERWRKILEESTKQCGRTSPPEIAEPCSCSEIPFSDLPSRRFAAIIDGDAKPLAHYDPGSSLAFAVGPEGDFSPSEKALFRREGFLSVSLGPRILKAGTAAAAGMAFFSLAREGLVSGA